MKIGDIVELKSGSDPMTVEGFYDTWTGKRLVNVAWFSRLNIPMRQQFQDVMLKVISGAFPAAE